MSLSFRPARPEDASKVLHLLAQYHNEVPDLEEFVVDDQQRSPELMFWRLIAEMGDEVVGVAQLEARPSTPPGWLDALVLVNRTSRHQGVGRHLIAALEQQAQALGLVGLEAAVRNDDADSLAWAHRRQFAPDFQRFESVLEVNTFQAERFGRVVEELEAAGIQLVTLADLPDEDTLRQLHALDNRVFLDTPDAPGRMPLCFERFGALVANNPRVPREGVIIALDGKSFVGLTVLMHQGTELYTGLTGVDRAYRGRRIALALKVRSIAYAQSLGVQRMRTNNHSRNTRMIAVNDALGYVSQPGWWVIKRELGAPLRNDWSEPDCEPASLTSPPGTGKGSV